MAPGTARPPSAGARSRGRSGDERRRLPGRAATCTRPRDGHAGPGPAARRGCVTALGPARPRRAGRAGTGTAGLDLTRAATSSSAACGRRRGRPSWHGRSRTPAAALADPRPGPQHRRRSPGRPARARRTSGRWSTALDRGLCADPALAALPGRFLFAVDDGARRRRRLGDATSACGADGDGVDLVLAGRTTGIARRCRRGRRAVALALAAARAFLDERAGLPGCVRGSPSCPTARAAAPPRSAAGWAIRRGRHRHPAAPSAGRPAPTGGSPSVAAPLGRLDAAHLAASPRCSPGAVVAAGARPAGRGAAGRAGRAGWPRLAAAGLLVGRRPPAGRGHRLQRAGLCDGRWPTCAPTATRPCAAPTAGALGRLRSARCGRPPDAVPVVATTADRLPVGRRRPAHPPAGRRPHVRVMALDYVRDGAEIYRAVVRHDPAEADLGRACPRRRTGRRPHDPRLRDGRPGRRRRPASPTCVAAAPRGAARRRADPVRRRRWSPPASPGPGCPPATRWSAPCATRAVPALAAELGTTRTRRRAGAVARPARRRGRRRRQRADGAVPPAGAGRRRRAPAGRGGRRAGRLRRRRRVQGGAGRPARGLEHLVVRGRRGGSAIAAAAVNALASERRMSTAGRLLRRRASAPATRS